MKKIYEYLDYRKFLGEYYSFKKEENSLFSLRMLGRFIDIDASYLSKVISEKRHISPKSIPNIIDHLKFNKNEANYFNNLFYFNKSKSDEERRGFFEILLSLRESHTKNIESYQYTFYSKWYYTALRNILEFYKFYKDGDYTLLGKQLSPAISKKDAFDGIKLLTRLDLIKLDDDNRYILTDIAITTGESWNSIAIRNYQIETIELSASSLERDEKKERDISTITMNISEEEFEKIREMLQQFRSSVVKYVNGADNPDRVYQLNMQMIPLSKNSDNNNSEPTNEISN